MGRIFVTGDTHRSIDISKLNSTNFPEQKNLTKKDFLIICGDLGVVWDDSKEDMYWREWLNSRNFTTLWVDGNHENHKLLGEFPVANWNGGKVSFIKESLIHLKRGQVFDIYGSKFFTMGGASSIDKASRIEGKSWWKEELPSMTEVNEALDNLEKHNYIIDYVITHTASLDTLGTLATIKENNILNGFFKMIERDLTFKHWYFGHFHKDIEFEKHTLLYNKIVEIKNKPYEYK